MLKGKCTLITGATSGIGLACAEKLASEGSNLIITGRRSERLTAISKKLEAEYKVRVLPLMMDVTVREDVSTKFKNIPEDFKQIDILVNNAGLAAGVDLAHEANLDDWDQMIDTNLKGLMYVTRQVLPGMIERNNGHLINIASTAGHIVYPGGSVYCATKHAVRAVSKTLMLELMDYDIRVSSVDPGMVRTEFSEVRLKGDKSKAEDVYKGFDPLLAEDIADAVHYVVTRPSHVMIGEMVIYASSQGDGRSVSRKV